MNGQRIAVLVFLLCLIAGSNSQWPPLACSDPNQKLMNKVVYEGDSSSFSYLPIPNNVMWWIYPSYDPYGVPIYNIADDNSIQPLFITAYNVTPTLLSIYKVSAHNDQPPDPCSTSGFYILAYKDFGCESWANLIAVANGPSCLCTAIDPDTAYLSCELYYGEATNLPNRAKMTWYDNSGNQVAAETPNQNEDNGTYLISTSTYPITSSDAASYTCAVTFSAPDVIYDNMATNAPSFNASCTIANCVKTTSTTTIEPESTTTTPSCPKDLINIVAYEGSVAEFENADDGKPVKWHFSSSSDPENNLLDITDYDNKVNPMFVGAYGVTRTKLTILNATVAPQGRNRYSTAGVYFLTYQSTACQTAANLIVIQSRPMCDRNENDPNNAILSCNISYAESERQPLYPTMTWTTDGVVIAIDTPTPQKYAYVNESLSLPPVDNTASSYYQCQVTFDASPPVAYPIPFLAQNTPSFTGSCTVASGTFPPTTEIATTTAETTAPTTTTEIVTTTTETTIPTTTTEIATTTEVCVDSPTCSSKWLSDPKAFCPYVDEFRDDCPEFCGVCVE